MNAHSNNTSVVPVWLWAALSAGVLLLIGAIWLAASDDGRSRAKVSVEPYPSTTGAGPSPIANPPSAVPPGGVSPGVSAPLGSGGALQPRVTVTPIDPNALSAVARKPAKPKVAKRRVSPVADMFPVGPIIPRIPRATSPAPREDRATPPPVPEESFPGFTYGGAPWHFTGAFARAAELELAPTGVDVGGRGVFGLANTAGPVTILFVQSQTDPGKYAIYR